MNATADVRYQAVMGELRAEMGRQQVQAQDVAERAGISASTLSRRLREKTSPFTLPEVLRMCDALGVSLEDLLAEAKKRTPVPAPRIGGVPDRVTDGELRSMLDLAA